MKMFMVEWNILMEERKVVLSKKSNYGSTKKAKTVLLYKRKKRLIKK